MSREIKFRAWDNTKKEWTLNIMECVSSRTGNIWMEPALKSHKVVIEQYTGSKDKNGKEIYEGDILDTPGGRCLCVWDDDGWTYQFKVHRTDWFDIVKDFHKNSEVIGNIHENPELLEDENE